MQDIGKSILESYSRALESLAFNIVARIDDLLYVDDLTRHSDQSVSISEVNAIAIADHNSVKNVSKSGTPNNTAFTTPSTSPVKQVERPSANLERNKLNHRGLGVRKVLTDYLSIDTSTMDSTSPASNSSDSSSANPDAFSEDAVSSMHDSIGEKKNELENLVPLTKASIFVSECFQKCIYF